jgi:hypothetical protein
MMTTRRIGLRNCLLMGALILVLCTGTRAGTVGLSAHLTGPSGGGADAAFVLDDTAGVLLSAVAFNLADSFTLSSAVITDGSGGPVIHTLDTSLVSGLTQGAFTDIWTGLTASDIRALESDTAYITIRTAQSPTGGLSGRIQVIPEPAGLVLLGTGAVALLGCAARRRARPRAGRRG